MATYNPAVNVINPNKPVLRGLDTTYDSTGQNKLGGTGLADLYKLDYDQQKIESMFNQGTDAQFAVAAKQNQIAENQSSNMAFSQQNSAIEALRQQRNNQISSGMARGLNAAAEQGTVLGLQQANSAGALQFANQKQMESDKLAAEYALNVQKAMQQSNTVKQAMAGIAAQMYEADTLGYTGELGYAGQMDENATNRYGYEVGLEGTQYTANKNYEGVAYNADKNYAGTVYGANSSYDANKYATDAKLTKEQEALQDKFNALSNSGPDALYEKFKNNEDAYVMQAVAAGNGNVTEKQARATWTTYANNEADVKNKADAVKAKAAAKVAADAKVVADAKFKADFDAKYPAEYRPTTPGASYSNPKAGYTYGPGTIQHWLNEKKIG